MLGLMASASSVLQLGLLRMRPLQFWLKARVPRRAWASGLLRLKVNQKCFAALIPWKANDWYQSGVSLGTSSSVKVLSTDASTSGWGALLEGRPFFGQWSEREKLLHINCLEMLAVDNALTRFCPQIRGHHVLVRSDNMSVVSYINRQGGLRSRNLHRLTERLLVWAQRNMLSLRAAHVPGLLNVGPDRLSRNNVPTGEWSLHPQTVQLLWKKFGRAEVDLFASQENAHCLEFFSKSRDALAHERPRRPLYAFPPVSLLHQKKLCSDSVDLSGIPLSTRDIRHVAYYLQTSGGAVISVDLSFTELRDEGLRLLLPFLGALPKLTTLALNGNRLTLGILKDLSEALKESKRFTCLAWIDLGNNVDIFTMPQSLLVSLRRRCSLKSSLPTIYEYTEGQPYCYRMESSIEEPSLYEEEEDDEEEEDLEPWSIGEQKSSGSFTLRHCER
ncbi:unnamed protein product [Leuciscus chuanchicus]